MIVEDLGEIEPVKKVDGRTAAERLELFGQANHSLALEGMNVDSEDLEIQGRVARGELSTEEAVAIYVRRARGGE